MKKTVLIYPPMAKISEPPPGIAKLSGFMKSHHIPHNIIDANFEGIMNLLYNSKPGSDTWTKRSVKNLNHNLEILRSYKAFLNTDRYKKVVIDINRVLSKAVSQRFKITLSNYQDSSLSPVKSDDIIKSYKTYQENPFYHYFKTILFNSITNTSPDIIGISLNYLSQALCSFAMIGFLKTFLPSVKIILGGGLVTSWMRNPDWQNPFYNIVDEIIAGQGETFFAKLYGFDQKTHYTPNYDVLFKNQYLSPAPVLSYSASSGCFWHKCSFCPEKAENNPYKPILIDLVLSDLENLINTTRPGLVHFVDNAISIGLLKKLTKQDLKTPWYGFAKVSKIFTNFDFCGCLKKSGCVMLKLGLESGDQTVLDNMQKGIDLKTVSIALKNLKKAGIATYIYLLFGTPYETEQQALKTFEFTVKHSKEISFLNLAIFNLPVYGPDVQNLKVTDFYEGDLSLYKQFQHPKGWDRHIVRQFLDKKFKKDPAIASIVKKDPPFFTSNHAPFFGFDWNIQ